MADPLLTTLCAICHAQPPKYTCPACHTNTCSLPCTQRHKTWSSCTGRRDPTAFLPLHKLKTPAGIDHDYNFLSAIERARERVQRALLSDDQPHRRPPLFSATQLGRDLDSERRWRREWFGDEVRFVSTDAGGSAAAKRGMMCSDGEDGDDDDQEQGGRDSKKRASALARRVHGRLGALGIEVVRMPLGMARQRDNTTAWNRRAGRINWCVEWIVYGDDDSPASSSSAAPLRIRHKALETRPLYRALGDSLAWYNKGSTKRHDHHHHQQPDDSDDYDAEFASPYARKRRRVLIKELKEDARRSAPQDAATGTFQATPYPTQNPYTGAWETDRAAAVASWLGDEVVARKRGWRFYLLKPLTPAGKDRELIPCSGEESLGDVLKGRTVVEFPTVYVLAPSAAEDDALPPGFVLGSVERRAPIKRLPKRKAEANGQSAPDKRQRGGARGGGGITAARGRGHGSRKVGIARRPREEREEGEIASGEEEEALLASRAADTTSSDPDTSSGGDDDGHDDDDVGEGMDVDGTIVANAASIPATSKGDCTRPAGLGLVDYGSSSDEGEGGEEGEVTDVDLASLKPEDPELVAGAIREIVGLLT